MNNKIELLDKPYSEITVYHKLEVFMKQNKKIKFRLRDNPSYEVRGEIIKLGEKETEISFEGNNVYKLNPNIPTIIKLDEGTEMVFDIEEILPHTLFPLEYNPIVSFNRVQIQDKLRNFIFNRDNYECKLNLDGCSKVAEHIDHIIPVSKGGLNTPENLQASCSNCNLKKGDKIIY